MSADRPGKGLGMGLQALIGEAERRPAPEGEPDRRGGVREIDIAQIVANPGQPRSRFDEEALNELAESIRERGVLQPILLRPHGEGFQVIAGERRWRAAQRAGLHAIPAIVREIDDSTTAEIALIENIQREDLNALEEAEGYRQLIKAHGHTQDGVAKIVHKSRSHVANLLRLLDLPEYVRLSLVRGDISMGHARAVAAAPDPEALTREVIAKGLSVRQAEERARREHARPGPGIDIARASARNAQPVDADLVALERQLGDILGLKVQVVHKGQGGAVTLHYSSLDQLDMICQRLSGEPI
jgi:ParB family chromosome partitioning protein